MFGVLALLALSAPAFATIYTTYPVASTKINGGQALKVEWTDDGQAPDLATIGVVSVDLCVGSTQQQTCVQNLAQSVNVANATSVTATIDPQVGANGDFYFIRYTSRDYYDPVDTHSDYMQFSARFELSGMKGTFDANVQQQIAAYQSTANATAAPTASGTTNVTASASATPSGAANRTASASASAAVSGASALANASTSAAVRPSVSAAPSAAPSATPSGGAAARAAPVALALIAGVAGYVAL